MIAGLSKEDTDKGVRGGAEGPAHERYYGSSACAFANEHEVLRVYRSPGAHVDVLVEFMVTMRMLMVQGFHVNGRAPGAFPFFSTASLPLLQKPPNREHRSEQDLIVAAEPPIDSGKGYTKLSRDPRFLPL